MKRTLFFAIILCAFASASLPAFAQKTTSTQIQYTFEKHKYKIRYQGEVNVGYANSVIGKPSYTYNQNGKNEGYSNGDTPFNNISINTIHGLRFTKWLYVGIGLGVDYLTPLYLTPNLNNNKEEYPVPNHLDKPSALWQLPFFGNIKFIWPVSDDFSLCISANAGGSANLGKTSYSDYDVVDGKKVAKSYDEPYIENAHFSVQYFGEYGIGMTYKMLNLSIGCLQQPIRYDYTYTYYNKSKFEQGTYSYWVKSYSLFIKVGIRFGQL